MSDRGPFRHPEAVAAEQAAPLRAEATALAGTLAELAARRRRLERAAARAVRFWAVATTAVGFVFGLAAMATLALGALKVLLYGCCD